MRVSGPVKILPAGRHRNPAGPQPVLLLIVDQNREDAVERIEEVQVSPLCSPASTGDADSRMSFPDLYWLSRGGRRKTDVIDAAAAASVAALYDDATRSRSAPAASAAHHRSACDERLAPQCAHESFGVGVRAAIAAVF